MAATPLINSTVNAKDSDMARSLAADVRCSLDLDQPAFHDRAGRYVRPATGHRPAVERRSYFDISKSFVERPGSGVIVLNQHPGQRPTMIDDLELQRADQLCASTEGSEPFVHREHPDIAGMLRWAEVDPTHGDQAVVRQRAHQQRDLSGVGSLEGGCHRTNVFRPT